MAATLARTLATDLDQAGGDPAEAAAAAVVGAGLMLVHSCMSARSPSPARASAPFRPTNSSPPSLPFSSPFPSSPSASSSDPVEAAGGGASFRNTVEARVALQAVHAMLRAGDVESAAVSERGIERGGEGEREKEREREMWGGVGCVWRWGDVERAVSVGGGERKREGWGGEREMEWVDDEHARTHSPFPFPPLQILTPYRGQVRCLEALLRSHAQDFAGFNVTVGSVDGYQGREADVVVLTAVRCNR